MRGKRMDFMFADDGSGPGLKGRLNECWFLIETVVGARDSCQRSSGKWSLAERAWKM